MVAYLTRLAACLQVLFTTTAEALGKTTGFVQRRRKLTASGLAQTLVFRWAAQPKTTMESMALELDVSPQALQQHLGPKAEAFLRALLENALAQALKIQPQALGLLNRFGSTIIEDTTVIALPASLAEQFPGCGGGGSASEGAASVKVLVRWNLSSGELLALTVHAGRTSDQTLAAEAGDLPPCCMHLADMGFFNSERWLTYGKTQYWISRVPTRTQVYWQGVWQTLGQLLDQVTEAEFDADVLLVQKTGLPCRLAARRCPEEVANRRRQKLREYTRDKKGREPSVEQLALCAWLIFATNVPAEMLSVKEVWVVYRCRWQVEVCQAHCISSVSCSRSSCPEYDSSNGVAGLGPLDGATRQESTRRIRMSNNSRTAVPPRADRRRRPLRQRSCSGPVCRRTVGGNWITCSVR